MRNANPRDGEIGRSWGKWFPRKVQQRTTMVHAHERARVVPIGKPGIGSRWLVTQEPECQCGCKGDPFICIEADGS